MYNYNFIERNIEEYVEKHAPVEDEILSALNRETNVKHLYPRMISGPVQGAFLSFLVKLFQPTSALELGAYTGYSAITIARALPQNAILDSVEIKEEFKSIHSKYFRLSGVEEKIRMHYDSAKTFLESNNLKYDFIFLDADKANYPSYYEPLIGCLNPGGLLLADNVLWYGKVVEQDEKDKQLKGIIAFNELASADTRTESMILTIRDGLYLIRKKA